MFEPNCLEAGCAELTKTRATRTCLWHHECTIKPKLFPVDVSYSRCFSRGPLTSGWRPLTTASTSRVRDEHRLVPFLGLRRASGDEGLGRAPTGRRDSLYDVGKTSQRMYGCPRLDGRHRTQ